MIKIVEYSDKNYTGITRYYSITNGESYSYTARHPFLNRYEPYFFKFFKKEKYANEFCKGLLNTNPTKFYREITDDICRSDENEGLIEEKNGKKLFDERNICCLYSLNIDNIEKKLHPMSEQLLNDVCLGEYAVCIMNNQAFADKLMDFGKKKKSYGLEYNWIKYDNALGMFHKSERYINQQEFRIVISPNIHNCNNFKIDIGDISNITKILKTKEISSRMKIKEIQEN